MKRSPTHPAALLWCDECHYWHAGRTQCDYASAKPAPMPLTEVWQVTE